MFQQVVVMKTPLTRNIWALSKSAIGPLMANKSLALVLPNPVGQQDWDLTKRGLDCHFTNKSVPAGLRNKYHGYDGLHNDIENAVVS